MQQLQRSCSHLLLLDMEIFLTLKWIIPFIEQHFILISVFIMHFFFNLSSVILPVTEAAFEVFLAIKDGKLTLSITSLHVAGHFNIAILASRSQKYWSVECITLIKMLHQQWPLPRNTVFTDVSHAVFVSVEVYKCCPAVLFTPTKNKKGAAVMSAFLNWNITKKPKQCVTTFCTRMLMLA